MRKVIIKILENKSVAVGILVLAALFRIGMVMISGYTYGGDSKGYISQAEELINNGIGFYINHIGTPHYWGYPSFLALMRLVVGADYKAVAIAQVIMGVISTYLLYRIVCKFEVHSTIAAISVLVFSCTIDIFVWDSFILSDSLGISFEILVLYLCFLLTNVEWGDKRYLLYGLLWLLSCAAYVTTRVHGLAIVLPMLVFLIARLPRPMNIIIGLIFLAMAIAVVTGVLLLDQKNLAKQAWDAFGEWFLSGSICLGRPEYDLAPYAEGSKLLYCMKVLGVRMVFFWNIYVAEYSLIHKLWCLATILPMFVMGGWSAFLIFKRKQKRLYPVIAMLLCEYMFIVLTQIDFDMRYRVQVLAPLTIIAAYGLNDLYQKLKRGQADGHLSII